MDREIVTMILHCSVYKGLKPSIFDKICGVIVSDATAVNLCLTSPSSNRMVSNNNLARIFGLIIHKLAAEKSIKLLFPYDVKSIKKKLLKFNLKAKEERNWIRLDIPPQQRSDLFHVLEVASFTTFFAQVDELTCVPKKPSDLINSLDQKSFLGVFTLYDESMEILSMRLLPDSIIALIHEIGLQEKIQIIENNSTCSEQ